MYHSGENTIKKNIKKRVRKDRNLGEGEYSRKGDYRKKKIKQNDKIKEI